MQQEVLPKTMDLIMVRQDMVAVSRLAVEVASIGGELEVTSAGSLVVLATGSVVSLVVVAVTHLLALFPFREVVVLSLARLSCIADGTQKPIETLSC
jgi:transketolase